jgi:UDP-N-acetyl-D-galactosamine dehydrogenase
MEGRALKARAGPFPRTLLVIYESTVYLRATEEVCVPILERESGLCFNATAPGGGFMCGYTPERINPGDTYHKLTAIKKVTSDSSPAAAKVIENTLRDLNFALVNELAIIFRQVLVPTGVRLVLNGIVPRQLGALRL